MTACIVCRRSLAPTERQCCLRCLSTLRRDLAKIESLFGMLPSVLARLPAGTVDSVLGRGSGEPPLPGGDALAMMGPGSAATGDGGELVGHRAGEPVDPPAVSFELGTWVEDWCEIRHEVGRRPVTVRGQVGYLSSRAGWASDHHPAWDEFSSDVRRIVARLEDVTGTSERPEHGPPCPYCRADLEREFGDQGLADDWQCPRCRRAFGPAQYLLAVRASLAAESDGSPGA